MLYMERRCAKILGLIFLLITTMATAAHNFPPPRQLEACPSSPNCVQSQDPQHKRYIAPIELKFNSETSEQIDAVWDSVKALVLALPRAEIIAEEPGYLHITVSSRVFKFVDDIEITLDADAGLVHLRSASRQGYYDFGVNRQRIEKLRQEIHRLSLDSATFAAALQTQQSDSQPITG